jgi:hypothetical protein
MSHALNTCLISPKTFNIEIKYTQLCCSVSKGLTLYCNANTGVWRQPGRKVCNHMESSIAEQAGNLSKVPQH